MKRKSSRYPFSAHLRGPILIAGIYLVIGALWILFSDRIAAEIAPDPSALTQISTYKGWGYVSVTALLLYLLIRRHSTALLKNEKQLRLITDALPALISYVGADRHYRFNNKAYHDWFGRDAAKMHMSDVLGMEAYQIILPYVDKVLTGETVNYQTVLPYKNSGDRYINASYIPDVGEAGDVRGFFSLVQDMTEHRRTEDELRLWADAFEGCAHGIAIHEPLTSSILACNSAFAKMHDRTVREVVNISALNLFAESDRDLVLRHLEKADRVGRVRFEANKIRKGNSVFNAQVDVVSVRDENGKIRYRVSTAQDITDRKVSEDALARSEKRYRSLFENMTNGFARCQMIYDAEDKPIDFIYLDVNNAFKKLPGLHDVIGKRVTDLIPNIRETNPELFEIYGHVASTGEPEQFESYVPGLGLGMWFSISAFCPEPGFFVAFFETITERKQAEMKLLESERRYRELVQNANSAILRWKSDGTISFFNEYAQEFFGYTSEEILGRDVNILVPRTESTGGDLSNLVKNIIEHPEQFENVVNENICSDGRRVWMAWTNQPAYDENGQVTEILAVGLDITERKRAEESLKRNHKQLLSFIEQAPISISMFDRNMNYLSASHRWILEFGKGHNELAGLNHYDVNPDIPEDWKIAHQKGVAGQTSKNDDDLWIQSDGTKFWLRWTVTPWTDENGEIGGIIISAEDISERKRAEAAAFQNEQRYHRVLDAMMEGCQIIDFEWHYVYVNEVVAQQGRYKPEELVGKTMMEMYPGIEQTEMFAVLEKCMSDRESRRMENRFVFPDGNVGWFELSIQPAQEGIFILSTDITERVEALQTISDLARFPEENPNPVLRVNVDGRIIYANPGSEILLKDWSTNVGGMLPESLSTLTAEIYRKKTRHIIDIPVGDLLFEAIFTPIPEAGYVNIYGHDITERRRMEDVLRESEERLRLSLQAANQGLYDLNVQTGDAVVNRQYAEMLGYDYDTFVETNAAWIERLHPDDNEATAKMYSDYVNGLTSEYRVEFRQRTKDGDWKWILSLGKVVEYDKDGNPLRMLGTHTDITERKQAEAEILRLNEELEQRVIERTSQLDAANKELEAFAYSVSHDLRAPLRAIDGFTQILREDYEPLLGSEGKRVCGVISRETVRMGHLIDDLLSFSRLSRVDMHSISIDMKEMAASVFGELTRNEDKARIDFHLDEIPVTDGDARLLHQVWVNLISNALKFTSGKKRAVIEVKAEQNRNENVYSVRDNGAGFDMEYVHKLFGVFQRLHSESEFEGTGVGLAIVQRVIHRHGGRVWAEGKVGEGATFHFSIPRKGAVS